VLDGLGARGVQDDGRVWADRDLAAVNCLQQRGPVGGDQVDRLDAHRLVGGDRAALADVSTAKSRLRLRWRATASAKAAASLTTLSEISPPCRSTGVAAPIVVPGAMAARWAEKVMIAPAEAARAPEGVTYTTTGTRAFRKVWVISRIEASSPPGVSSSTSRAAWPSRSAMRTPSASYSATSGVIGPSTRETRTVGAWPLPPAAEPARSPAPTRQP